MEKSRCKTINIVKIYKGIRSEKTQTQTKTAVKTFAFILTENSKHFRKY